MALNPILINRENRTIHGVQFSDIETLNKTANAICSNMFEEFEPTQKSIEIIRDYVTNKITLSELIRIVKEGSYA